jgi:hypothetical protein
MNLSASLQVDERTQRWIFAELARRLERDYRIELALQRKPDSDGYDFSHGEQAERRLEAIRRTRAETGWIGVFRRVR